MERAEDIFGKSLLWIAPGSFARRSWSRSSAEHGDSAIFSALQNSDFSFHFHNRLRGEEDWAGNRWESAGDLECRSEKLISFFEIQRLLKSVFFVCRLG